MFKPGDALIQPHLIAVIVEETSEGFNGATRRDDGKWWPWEAQRLNGYDQGWSLHPKPDEAWAEFVKWELTK